MTRRRRTAAIAAVISIIATACSGDDPAADPQAEPDATAATTTVATADADAGAAGGDTDLVGEIQALVDDFVGDGPGGAAVLVRSADETALVAAGDADADGQPLEPDQRMRVGSISKPFVAVMVMQLVDEGRITLDDELITHLPNTPVGGTATIDQLLGHRSGIPNYTDQPSFFADVGAEPDREFSADDVLAYVDDVSPGPVEQFAYSNTNYLLLGQLIEVLDGTALNSSLERRITGPLGLDDTVFATWAEPSPSGLAGAWGAGLDGDPAAPYAALASSAAGAGALVSTVDDLAVFLTALAGGELVSDGSFVSMSDVDDDGYGYGLLRVVLGEAGSGFGHSGGIPGFTSTMAISEDGGDLLAIITNADALLADELAFRIVTR